MTPAQYWAPDAEEPLIEAEPPIWIWLAVPGGFSPPAQIAHGGSRNFTLLTTVWIFLIAIGLVLLGTYPIEVTTRSLLAAPSATVTMKPPAPMATYCDPSYGAGTGDGSGSASAPVVPGAVSPFDSAQIARSSPDSAMARAWAFII